ncbi:hypothetical protein DFH06DRAFT_1288680 [Mycena polygramma]|nr:hypothetical protein DFH06DRAFT_1288680 [Mycena polygramma]
MRAPGRGDEGRKQETSIVEPSNHAMPTSPRTSLHPPCLDPVKTSRLPAECYEEILENMKRVASSDEKLTAEEQNLLSVAYKNSPRSSSPTRSSFPSPTSLVARTARFPHLLCKSARTRRSRENLRPRPMLRLAPNARVSLAARLSHPPMHEGGALRTCMCPLCGVVSDGRLTRTNVRARTSAFVERGGSGERGESGERGHLFAPKDKVPEQKGRGADEMRPVCSRVGYQEIKSIQVRSSAKEFGTNTDESLTRKLEKQGIKAKAYHAGLTSKERTSVQAEWKSGKCCIIVATLAFGMGIDKNNGTLLIPKPMFVYDVGLGLFEAGAEPLGSE